MKSKIIKISVLALSLAMLGGCGNMEKMQADINAANAAAAAAMSKATDAYNLASKGHGIASEAAHAASKAQATADAALECCNENSAKIDRMFEKAMMK
jgi:Alanine-zipper, major outer membrane lipoprotein